MVAEAAAIEAIDLDRSVELYDAILALDPDCARARLGVAGIFERAGERRVARQYLEAITGSEALPHAVRSTAIERLGDLHFRAEDFESARARYGEVLERLLSEDRRRTVSVKLVALERAVSRVAVGALLLGEGPAGPKPMDAMARLGEWRSALPDDGLPRYLIARQLANAKSWQHASDELATALARPLPPLVEAEALRLGTRIACALGVQASAMRHVERAEKLDVIAPNRKTWLRDFAWRCVH
jgi:tetratricopeptide (TPR) repeat protein